MSVDSTWTVVDFPDPFGPSSANTLPVGTLKSTLSSAMVAPYRLRSPRTEMAFVVMNSSVQP
jgi:hypothetical protein